MRKNTVLSTLATYINKPPRKIHSLVRDTVFQFLKGIDSSIVLLTSKNRNNIDKHADFLKNKKTTIAFISSGERNNVSQVNFAPKYHLIYNFFSGKIAFLKTDSIIKICHSQHKGYSFSSTWEEIERNFPKSIFSVRDNVKEIEKFKKLYEVV